MLCVQFWREVKVGSKQHETAIVKYFEKPFYADNYTPHHKQKHPEIWKEYQKVSDEEKK